MKKDLKQIRNRISILFLSVFIVQLFSCGFKPEPEPLSISVNASLNLLQENPQFVMYLNFKSMRHTEFWKKNISDSLLNVEKTFGSLLNTFKLATGASISDGMDELFYSNSWFGENSIVLKGIFDRNKLQNYLYTDSLFSVTKNADGIDVYIKKDNGLYFYFRDNFTICASNYLKQIDIMIQTKDTAKSGLLLNEKVYSAIENVIYKEDLWMVSTEKIFIKGIFQNFMHSTGESGSADEDSSNTSSSEVQNDSVLASQKMTIENLYKRFNSISFSAKMENDLKFLVQCECIDEGSAKYLRSVLSGLLTVARLSSSGKQKAPSTNLLNKLKLERFDNSVFIDLDVDESVLKDLKKTTLMSKPETN